MLPLRVRVLAPVLVRPPVPVMLPLRVALADALTVELAARLIALSTVVAPVRARVPPFRVRVPAASSLSLLTDRVPPVTVMPPLRLPELLALVSVSVPASVLFRLDAPPSVPLRVRVAAPAALISASPARVILPLRVEEPEFRWRAP